MIETTTGVRHHTANQGGDVVEPGEKAAGEKLEYQSSPAAAPDALEFPPRAPKVWEVKGQLSVHRLYAGRIEGAMRQAAFNLGLRIELQELSKNIRDKVIGYVVTGDEEGTQRFEEWMRWEVIGVRESTSPVDAFFRAQGRTPPS